MGKAKVNLETLLPKLARFLKNVETDDPVIGRIHSYLKGKNLKKNLQKITSYVDQQPFPILLGQQIIAKIPTEKLYQGLGEILSEIFSEGPIQPIEALDDFLNRLKINNLSLSVEKDMLEIIQEFIEWVSYIERQSHIRIINPNKEPHFPDSGKVDTVIILNNINKLIGRSFNILKNSLSQPIFYNPPFFREEDFLGYATMFFFALLILREIAYSDQVVHLFRRKPSIHSDSNRPPS